MHKIGLLGDTHGKAKVVLTALQRFKNQGITDIVQVGDFGFWPGTHGQTFLTYVNNVLLKNGQTLYVTPGNHEDYKQINALHVHEDGWMRARPRILVAPRGHRWEWNGKSFVSLGGAPSVDRAWRVRAQRRDGFPVWWAEEDITDEDMVKTMAGGYADVMITHDAPLGVSQVEMGIAGNPHGFEAEDIKYADQGRQKMLNVVDVVHPKLLVHGHYHFMVDDKLELFNEKTGLDDEVHIIGMNADGEPGTLGVLNLEDLSVEFWR